jgi:hypothetical protein
MGYEKGETGNIRGQIRRKPIRDALDALMSRTADDPLADKPKTIAQKIALELIKDASSSNEKIRLPARTELIDRTDGKAIQAVEHSGHIAKSHEEELTALDNPDSDDPTREGDTSSAP